jgi:hypothetical protein
MTSAWIVVGFIACSVRRVLLVFEVFAAFVVAVEAMLI